MWVIERDHLQKTKNDIKSFLINLEAIKDMNSGVHNILRYFIVAIQRISEFVFENVVILRLQFLSQVNTHFFNIHIIS